MSTGVKIFSGRATKALASEIAECYGIGLGNVVVTEFSDGEFQPSLEETVRGQDVFLIQSTMPPTENLFELMLMIDAAKRASARSIVAVIPYFGFARQDRKDKPRVAIGAKLIADMLEAAGVSRVMTMDLHADQIQGFFNIPVDHIYASSIFLPYIKSLELENLVIASPDMGGTKRANAYSKFLNAPMVVAHKSREQANVVAEMTVIGDVKGKNVIILDDMIDTAGTVTKAADIMVEKGALSVRAIATHAVLSGPAYQRIKDSAITEVIVSDSIPVNDDCKKIKVISVANLFADTIDKVYNFESISSNFIL